MTELTTEEIKSIAFDVLCRFAQVCESNGFRYYLSGGTLLGAVRHKGFIPWDDDIDICMPRPDYDKFVEYCKNNETPFGLACYQIDNRFTELFAKAYDRSTVCDEYNGNRMGAEFGVFVDIFPMDGLGDTHKQACKFLRKSRFKRQMLTAANWKRYIKSKTHKWYTEPFRLAFYVLSRFCKPRKIVKKAEKIVRRNDYEDCKFVGVVCGCYGDREIMPASIFSDVAELEFEGKLFHAPIGYDEFLTNFYGDYMQLPPEEKRVAHHTFTAYRKPAGEKANE